jgi:hypothetical protein
MQSNEFRILGSELGETDSYVDVTISGIDEDGKIYFSENGGGRSWSVENGEARRLMNQNVMIPSSTVGAHALWGCVDDIGGERKHTITDDFADENAEEAQRALFLAAYFETR